MWTPEELKEIVDRYNQGLPTGYTDEEYDALLEEYIKAHGGESSRPYARNKQTDVVNELVSTLPKVYGTTKPMRENQRTYQEWINTKKINPSQHILIQPKFDGCSVAYDFISRRFFTRGDYENGESIDVTELFADRIDWITRWKENQDRRNPFNPIGVKFEAILDLESYDKYNRLHLDNQYKRPRDYVAAAITSRDIEMCSHISLIMLRALSSDGREYIPPELWNMSCQSTACDYDRIDQFIKECLINNATVTVWDDSEIDVKCNYKIDGVVVSVCEEEPGEECFVIDDKEVAIKILKDVKQTKLRDIIWQVGNTGKITPVAILQPVDFNGITVDHVTLSTFARVVDMDLRHNDTVDIMYNIVPYFIGSQHDGDIPIAVPRTCPTCGHPLSTHLVSIRCLNPKCPSVKIGSISRYCEKMKMMGLSDKTVSTLYKNGVVRSINQLYEINPTSISIIPGYGETSETNIINAIWKASTDVEIHKWFGAMPINDISDKTWKIIFSTIYPNPNDCIIAISTFIKDNDKDGFINTIMEYCTRFPNIGPNKLKSIVSGIHQTWDLICKTFPYIKFKIIDNNKSYKGTVAMTGTRDQELTAKLMNAGWNVVDFNTKVNLLVVPDKSFRSNKTESAMKHNIPIRTIEEVNDMLL